MKQYSANYSEWKSSQQRPRTPVTPVGGLRRSFSASNSPGSGLQRSSSVVNSPATPVSVLKRSHSEANLIRHVNSPVEASAASTPPMKKLKFQLSTSKSANSSTSQATEEEEARNMNSFTDTSDECSEMRVVCSP